MSEEIDVQIDTPNIDGYEKCQSCGQAEDTMDKVDIGRTRPWSFYLCTKCRRDLTDALNRRYCGRCQMKEKFDAGHPFTVRAVEAATEMFGGERDVTHDKCAYCKEDLCKRKERIVVSRHWTCIEKERAENE